MHDVTVADHVLVQQNDELVPQKVIDVSSIAIQGNYFALYSYFLDILSKLSTLKVINISKTVTKDIERFQYLKMISNYFTYSHPDC